MRLDLDAPAVAGWIEQALAWPEPALKRHNQAGHPLHLIALLADLGLRADDGAGAAIADRVLAQQGDDGALLGLVELPRAFGGSGEPELLWMACDAPLLLDALVTMGLGDDPRVQRAIDHLLSYVEAGGMPCCSSIAGMRGPGRARDLCPYANLLAVRVLSRLPAHRDGPACRAAAEVLLDHWAHRDGPKRRMFGIGTTYRRLKYPLVWYDLLHVLDALSRVPSVQTDHRFVEMTTALTEQADEDGRFVPGSVWMAFRGLDFAQKRAPSPTLTWAAARILDRLRAGDR